MKASITISQGDIIKAIEEYVKKAGWTVDGQIHLSHDIDNDRGMSNTTYSATMNVVPNQWIPK